MASHRWIKFWPQDWRDDECLKVCSLAARGLWIAMIGQMHKSEPYGHLIVNGKAPDANRLAAVVGNTTGKEVTALLNELESEGVFSRTPEGLIFSRRMVRDHKSSEAGREAVAKRYNKPDEPKLDPIRGATSPPNTLEAEAEAEAEAEGLPSTLRAKRDDPIRPPPTAENGFCGWENGREAVGGFFWDEAWPRIVEAARLDLKKWMGNEIPARKWMRERIEPETIVRAIERCASRPDYKPPATLSYFDKPVREAHAKATP